MSAFPWSELTKEKFQDDIIYAIEHQDIGVDRQRFDESQLIFEVSYDTPFGGGECIETVHLYDALEFLDHDKDLYYKLKEIINGIGGKNLISVNDLDKIIDIILTYDDKQKLWEEYWEQEKYSIANSLLWQFDFNEKDPNEFHIE